MKRDSACFSRSRPTAARRWRARTWRSSCSTAPAWPPSARRTSCCWRSRRRPAMCCPASSWPPRTTWACRRWRISYAPELPLVLVSGMPSVSQVPRLPLWVSCCVLDNDSCMPDAMSVMRTEHSHSAFDNNSRSWEIHLRFTVQRHDLATSAGCCRC